MNLAVAGPLQPSHLAVLAPAVGGLLTLPLIATGLVVAIATGWDIVLSHLIGAAAMPTIPTTRAPSASAASSIICAQIALALSSRTSEPRKMIRLASRD